MTPGEIRSPGKEGEGGETGDKGIKANEGDIMKILVKMRNFITKKLRSMKR